MLQADRNSERCCGAGSIILPDTELIKFLAATATDWRLMEWVRRLRWPVAGKGPCTRDRTNAFWPSDTIYATTDLRDYRLQGIDAEQDRDLSAKYDGETPRQKIARNSAAKVVLNKNDQPQADKAQQKEAELVDCRPCPVIDNPKAENDDQGTRAQKDVDGERAEGNPTNEVERILQPEAPGWPGFGFLLH